MSGEPSRAAVKEHRLRRWLELQEEIEPQLITQAAYHQTSCNCTIALYPIYPIAGIADALRSDRLFEFIHQHSLDAIERISVYLINSRIQFDLVDDIRHIKH